MHSVLLQILASLLLLVSQVFAAPAISGLVPRQQQCSNRLQRRAWHTLSTAEKRAYIDAELCLMNNRTAGTGLPAVQSRFDDLIATHQVQASNVHNDGLFLPFHRLHMHAHEKLLREECGYTGAQPYWDEARDAGNFRNSVVLDPETGFGGDGRPLDRCISDGPFRDYVLHNGPGFSNRDHCITRSISDISSRLTAQSEINNCLGRQNFSEAWPCIEDNPHNGGHGGIGGEMNNAISSPGDPLFYLHHTFIDRIWWQWQSRSLPARLTEISGYTTSTRPSGGWVNVTLEDSLDMKGIIPNAQIKDVMNIGGGYLCYEYV